MYQYIRFRQELRRIVDEPTELNSITNPQHSYKFHQ